MTAGGSGHVGDLVSAFVDDQLDLQRRDTVLVHITGCPVCRDEVDHQRRMKTRLRALGGPGLPPDLLSRLNAFGGMVDGGMVDGGMVGGGMVGGGHGGLPSAPVPASGVRVSPRPAVRRDPQRALRLLAGAASLVLVGAGTAVAAASDGQPTSPVRSVSPALGGGRTASGSEAARSASGRSSETEDSSGLLQMPMNEASFATTSASLRR